MVTHKYVKSRKVYKLTFGVRATELPEVDVESLTVVGSFNGWDLEIDVMAANKKGNYHAVVEVAEPGSYEYRYLLNGDIWLNDWDAEQYVANEYGTDNCMVTIEAVG